MIVTAHRRAVLALAAITVLALAVPHAYAQRGGRGGVRPAAAGTQSTTGTTTGGMCTGTTSSGTTTISTAQAAALQQLAAQRQAAAARANAATTANLRAALMQTNALLAAQQSNPTLFTMQVRQQNPYVIALLQRQAALTAALQR